MCEQGQASFKLKQVADLGKILIFFGGILLVLGIVFLLIGKTNLPLGRLPGDIVYRGKHTTFYFPLATSIVLSVVLSVLLYVISRFRH
jgi:heme/copper-type cytochrome/quinol oxidase subunit 2